MREKDENLSLRVACPSFFHLGMVDVKISFFDFLTSKVNEETLRKPKKANKIEGPKQ
jgi:hypothetical protein